VGGDLGLEGFRDGAASTVGGRLRDSLRKFSNFQVHAHDLPEEWGRREGGRGHADGRVVSGCCC
jgi:hypothetical protein